MTTTGVSDFTSYPPERVSLRISVVDGWEGEGEKPEDVRLYSIEDSELSPLRLYSYFEGFPAYLTPVVQRDFAFYFTVEPGVTFMGFNDSGVSFLQVSPCCWAGIKDEDEDCGLLAKSTAPTNRYSCTQCGDLVGMKGSYPSPDSSVTDCLSHFWNSFEAALLANSLQVFAEDFYRTMDQFASLMPTDDPGQRLRIFQAYSELNSGPLLALNSVTVPSIHGVNRAYRTRADRAKRALRHSAPKRKSQVPTVSQTEAKGPNTPTRRHGHG